MTDVSERYINRLVEEKLRIGEKRIPENGNRVSFDQIPVIPLILVRIYNKFLKGKI